MDVADFVLLGSRRLPDLRPHGGILLVSRGTFPRSREGAGLLVQALDQSMAAHPGDADLAGEVRWLERPLGR